MLINRIKKIIKEHVILYIPIGLVLYLLSVIYSVTRITDLFYSACYYRTLKVLTSNHLTIGVKRLVKARTQLPHPVGIVIGMGVVLGVNCRIYQNVTIGLKDESEEKYPRIGNNVTIYAGAIIVGDVEVGDNCIIGASTVLCTSVPANCVVVGNPGKIISSVKTVSVSRECFDHA